MSIAFWSVLIAVVMPLVWTAIAKYSGRYDNHQPRVYLEASTGYRQRAHWAAQNAMEALPGFAAGVIIAHLAGADPIWMDRLAMTFVAFRVAHGMTYLADWATARSLVWLGGLAAIVGLFVAASQA
ncbi:MAG: MAPEG family protein [Lysobacterales bacterium]